jgi:hypothetical protein
MSERSGSSDPAPARSPERIPIATEQSSTSIAAGAEKPLLEAICAAQAVELQQVSHDNSTRQTPPAQPVQSSRCVQLVRQPIQTAACADDGMQPLLGSCCTAEHVAVKPQSTPASPQHVSAQPTSPAAAEPEQTSDSRQSTLPTSKSRAGQVRRKSNSHSSQAPKKARHEPPPQQQQAVPVQASTSAELGQALLALGVLSQRVSAFGCQAGQWVADDTIIAILAAICSDEASSLTHAGQSFEVS